MNAPGPKLIYLASPYSDRDQDVMEMRRSVACHVAARLIGSGQFVFSPIAHNVSVIQVGALPNGWEYWEQFDRLMLGRCDSLLVLRLDGWEASKGVQAEIAFAVLTGKQIDYIDP